MGDLPEFEIRMMDGKLLDERRWKSLGINHEEAGKTWLEDRHADFDHSMDSRVIYVTGPLKTAVPITRKLLLIPESYLVLDVHVRDQGEEAVPWERDEDALSEVLDALDLQETGISTRVLRDLPEADFKAVETWAKAAVVTQATGKDEPTRPEALVRLLGCAL